MEGNVLVFYLTYMWQTAGIIYILALAGILRGIYIRSKEIILLSSFAVPYFLFINNYVVRNDRTFLPLTPSLFLLASWFLLDIWKKRGLIQSKVIRSSASVVLVTLALCGLLFPLRTTISQTISVTAINSRETARVWIDENLPAGAKIALRILLPFR